VHEILAHVLAVGNYLNGGTMNGQADGFRIELLPRLSGVKACMRSKPIS
jgi:hypothetical protein